MRDMEGWQEEVTGRARVRPDDDTRAVAEDGGERAADTEPELGGELDVGYAPDADTADWPELFTHRVHPEDSERASKVYQECVSGTGTGGTTEHHDPMEYRVRRADESYVWVEAQGVVVRDAAGLAARYIATYTDITARREQEDALRQSVRLREEVERMMARLKTREAAPTIVQLQGQLDAWRKGEIDRMRAKLGALTPQQEEAIEALTRGLVNKIAHGPITELRKQSSDPNLLDMVRRLFRLGGDE